jgi:hypothetical protein
MPRRSSSTSSSNRSTSRSTARAIPPPRQTQQPNMTQQRQGGGLMNSLMTGMAFGAGAEMIRGLFRGGESHQQGQGGYEGEGVPAQTGGNILIPLILSGATAFGVHKFLFRPSPYRPLYSAAVFGGSFLLTRNLF